MSNDIGCDSDGDSESIFRDSSLLRFVSFSLLLAAEFLVIPALSFLSFFFGKRQGKLPKKQGFFILTEPLKSLEKKGKTLKKKKKKGNPRKAKKQGNPKKKNKERKDREARDPGNRAIRDSRFCAAEVKTCRFGADPHELNVAYPKDWTNIKILKFSTEIEHFKRATHQTPIFCGEFWSSTVNGEIVL